MLRYTLIVLLALWGALAFGDELVVFHMPGCRPCGYLKTTLADNPALVQEFTVSYIDITADPESARLFRVNSVPTVVRLNAKEQEVARLVGYDGKQAFARWLTAPDAPSSLRRHTKRHSR